MTRRPGIGRADIDAAFAALVQAALRDERAPTNKGSENPTGTMHRKIMSALLNEGRIRVEIYAKNWRVIEILTGPHAGKRTKAPPNQNSRPYKILPRSRFGDLPRRKAG